jgi:hypothetical protein
MRPPWAQRLFKRLAEKHDLTHFEGTAWKVHNLGQGHWCIVRRANNGDWLEFLPYTGESPSPSVRFYKKGPADAPQETPEP